jgi:hypothetical protein
MNRVAHEIFKLLFTVTGSFIVWMVNRFDGPFDHYMVAYHERFTSKAIIRSFIGLGFWMLVGLIGITLFSRPEQKTKAKPIVLEIITNENGEITGFKKVE